MGKILNELAEEHVNDMELEGEERRRAKNDYKAGFRERDEEVGELINTLHAIASWPGNISDEILRSRTGANDASYRGEMVITMRDLANKTLNKYNKTT